MDDVEVYSHLAPKNGSWPGLQLLYNLGVNDLY
jgi:hypothetical protein